MPHYDYQCNACGAVFEVEHPMGAKPRIKCPNCGSARTARQFSAAGVQFKGSGFYVTDSRDGDKKLSSGKDITPGKPDTPAGDPASKPEPSSKPDAAPAEKPAKKGQPAAE
jgi:putative FmdB family regulatory protein